MAAVVGIKKKGNHARRRKHPGIMGERPDNRERRQREALERNVVHQALSIQERMKKLLDRRKSFGGAVEREMNKLELELAKLGVPLDAKYVAHAIDSSGDETTEKRVKAKDRRRQERSKAHRGAADLEEKATTDDQP